jgi:hypothetical protein
MFISDSPTTLPLFYSGFSIGAQISALSIRPVSPCCTAQV